MVIRKCLARGSQLGRQVYETPESVSDSGVNIKDSGISGVNFLNHMTSWYWRNNLIVMSRIKLLKSSLNNEEKISWTFSVQLHFLSTFGKYYNFDLKDSDSGVIFNDSWFWFGIPESILGQVYEILLSCEPLDVLFIGFWLRSSVKIALHLRQVVPPTHPLHDRTGRPFVYLRKFPCCFTQKGIVRRDWITEREKKKTIRVSKTPPKLMFLFLVSLLSLYFYRKSSC